MRVKSNFTAMICLLLGLLYQSTAHATLTTSQIKRISDRTVHFDEITDHQALRRLLFGLYSIGEDLYLNNRGEIKFNDNSSVEEVFQAIYGQFLWSTVKLNNPRIYDFADALSAIEIYRDGEHEKNGTKVPKVKIKFKMKNKSPVLVSKMERFGKKFDIEIHHDAEIFLRPSFSEDYKKVTHETGKRKGFKKDSEHKLRFICHDDLDFIPPELRNTFATYIQASMNINVLSSTTPTPLMVTGTNKFYVKMEKSPTINPSDACYKGQQMAFSSMPLDHQQAFHQYQTDYQRDYQSGETHNIFKLKNAFILPEFGEIVGQAPVKAEYPHPFVGTIGIDAFLKHGIEAKFSFPKVQNNQP